MNKEMANDTHESRVIRVFVSSTFRDMQAERDELVKFIFPQLRKLCEQRGVAWGEVDLRWGISTEQKSDGMVLPICLEEIQRCRPYFIGVLGERYGWVPDGIPPELVKREAWLAEQLDHSVTELEILHGVLRNPEMAEHAIFYFRDPGYVDTLPPEERFAFLEVASSEDIEQYGAEEALKRSEKRKQKLVELKQRIRSSGFPVHENYRNPKEFGQIVLRDLISIINEFYPEGSQPDPIDRDAADHEAFALSRARVYIGRQAYLDRLDDHAHGDGLPLVVLGASGSGKSALLANWAIGFREKPYTTALPLKTSFWAKLTGRSRPALPQASQVVILMHFIGATPNSADWMAMVRRIMFELKRRLGIEGDIPDQRDALRIAFANWLQMAAKKGRVVLILDGLNQLEDRDQAPDLVWLPSEIPTNIRLILSTLPGRSLEALRSSGWPTLEVQPLVPDERKLLISNYLMQYTKVLSPAQVERLATTPHAANPLFLCILLEELRLFGLFEQLDQRIEDYLAAASVEQLYEKVLKRYEADYECDRPGLVKDALSLLWAARRGLSEVELLDLLGKAGEPLPQAYWSPLYLAAEKALVNHTGLIGFSHDYLRRAVERTYLVDGNAQQNAHLRLADYFEGFELGARKVDEAPWQLVQVKAWQRIYALLSDLPFLNAAWQSNEFEVKANWAQIEANSPLRMVSGYQLVLDAPGEFNSHHLWIIGKLLGDTGHPNETLAVRGYLVEHNRRSGDNVSLAASLGNQALILFFRGDLDGAMALHKEEEHIYRELGNKAGLVMTLGNQAMILKARGNLDAAMALRKEEESIYRELENKSGLARTFGNQALILFSRGDLDGAMMLYKEGELIFRDLGDKDGLAISLNNQATIFKNRGDLDEAMALLKDVESTFRELGNKAGLATSLGNQANILLAHGNSDGAMALYKEEERICHELGDQAGLARTLTNQALILSHRGDMDRSMTLFKEGEQIYREMGDKAGLAVSLNNQTSILIARNDLDGAMGLFDEEESICRGLGDQTGLARTLINQASILGLRMNQPAKALLLADEAYRLAAQYGYRPLANQIENIRSALRQRLG